MFGRCSLYRLVALALPLLGLTVALPWTVLAASAVQPRAVVLKNVPQELRPKGTLLHAMAWTDRAGDNLLVFAGTTQVKPGKTADDESQTTKRLVVRHYADGRLVREFNDAVQKCWADPSLDLLQPAYAVTDLDGDGVGEATFAYKLGCRSDVSPIGLKVLMTEGGEKYVLRGETRVPITETERVGGKYKADPAFNKAPPAFLPHAVKTWKAIVNEDLGG